MAAAFTGTEQEPLLGHPKYQVLPTAATAGSFGAVYLANNRTTGETVAIKCIKVHEYQTERMRGDILSELLNHRMLRHPSVVQFREVFRTRNHMAIVMDYANHGNLVSYVESRGGHLSESGARWLFQQLVLGLQYCHRMGVANRDIKLDNTLVHDGFANMPPKVKICDFGYSKGYWKSMTRSKVGTNAYMAPEVLRMVGVYNAQLADIWSCGVSLYAMLFGHFPFGTRGCNYDLERIPKLAWRGVYAEVSVECRLLLSGILVKPTRRLDMAGVLAHPWFKRDLPPDALALDSAHYLPGANSRGLQTEREICTILGLAVPHGVPRLLQMPGDWAPSARQTSSTQALAQPSPSAALARTDAFAPGAADASSSGVSGASSTTAGGGGGPVQLHSEEGILCHLCCTEKPTSGFLHGGTTHGGYCGECADKVMRAPKPNCPVCRSVVDRVLLMYS